MSCDGCNCENKVDERLVEIANKYRSVEGGIIGALHEVQDNFGYISSNVQKYLSQELNIPMSDIYGIITFYSRFTLKPKGKYNVQVCMGTACYVKGAEKILDKFKSELNIKEGETTEDKIFSLEAVRCVGACGLAPVVVINSDVYGKVEETKVKHLIEKYRNICEEDL